MEIEETKEYRHNLRLRMRAKQIIRKPNQCWGWTGTIDYDGQGRIWRRDGKAPWTVQQAVYLIRNKKIPNRPVLACPIYKPCTNWRHIGLSTQETLGDKILESQGRHRKDVTKKRRPKLTTDEQRYIYFSPKPAKVLAEEKGISVSYTINIKAGRKGHFDQHGEPRDSKKVSS